MEVTPGQTAYDAYCNDAGGVSDYTGDRLPMWEDQNPRTKRHWEAAAAAVQKRDEKNLG